ncbi:MAG: hypothetical protein HC869_26030 [Rhodospirillales bacterium]|nr:hypothetical protein [Rhodospirillales bacterium]
MHHLFAVTRIRGAAWDQTLPMEAQACWREHADFMNALHEDGFVILGGPLTGTSEILLVIRADRSDDVRTKLAADPWSKIGLLTIARIESWELRLGSF